MKALNTCAITNNKEWRLGSHMNKKKRTMLQDMSELSSYMRQFLFMRVMSQSSVITLEHVQIPESASMSFTLSAA